MSRQEIKDPEPNTFHPRYLFSNKLRKILKDKRLN
jgi:hypothetical protein